MSRRALLILNARSRHGAAQAERAIGMLCEGGFDLDVEFDPRADAIPGIIASAAPNVEAVIVGGGDGSINGVAQELAGGETPLGILPLGTVNSLARTLAIPTSLPEACAIIAEGRLREIDLGSVNGKVFLNVASFGMTTRATRELSTEAKRRWGPFAYPIKLLGLFSSITPFWVEIRANGENVRCQAVQVAVSNGGFIAGTVPMARDTAIDDQRLDLYIIEAGNARELIPALWAIASGRADRSPRIRVIHATEIEAITDRPRSIAMDGEIRTRTPAVFRLLPKALRVFAPPNP